MEVIKWPRSLVWAVVLAFGASCSGVVAALILQYAVGLEGGPLYMWVGVTSAVGAVVAQVFAAPWFTRWLDERPSTRILPTPDAAALSEWSGLLRRTVLEKRVLGEDSQREQMLRARDLMPLQITQDLDIRSSSSGKPRLRLGGEFEELSNLIRDWEDSKGRLVILGEPGYGKTFAALALIESINKATEAGQIAELFPLVDWHLWSTAHPDTTIEEWLIHELSVTYPVVPTTVTWSLISDGKLVPVFDGLDEVPAGARHRCRDALEAYAGREAPNRSFVITCRHDEYLELSPKWIGANRQVSLAGLASADIAAVLRRDAPPTSHWEEVARAIEAGDPHLEALLRSPLRLSAAIDVFESADPRQLLQLAREADAEEQLWDLLLATEDYAYEGSEPGQTKAWLSFLAGSMRSHGRQRLWLHELYLYGDPRDRHRFFLFGGMIFMSPLLAKASFDGTISAWLAIGLLLLWVIYFYYRKRDLPLPLPVRHRTNLANYVKAVPDGILAGLMVGLVWVVAMTPIFSLIDLITHVAYGQSLDLEHSGLVGLTPALFTALSVSILTVGSSVQEEGSFSVIEEPPDQLAGRGPGAVIRATRNHALVASGIALMLLAPINFLILPESQSLFVTAIGTFIFAWTSLEAWAFYHWTRWRLARKGYLPLRLRHFLDWVAKETRLLRVSDSYEFRHRSLLEHLARGTTPVGAANISLNPAPRVSPTRRVKLVDFSLPAPEEETKPNVRLGELGRHRDNVAAAQEAVHLRPDDAEAVAKLGLAHNRAGNPASALPHLQRAVGLDPEESRHAASCALVLSTLGEDERALEVIEAAMERCSSGTQQLRRRREWVLRNLRSRTSAIETAEAVIEAKPDDALGLWDLALAKQRAGRTADAVESRRQAVELARGSRPAALRLGMSLAMAGYSAEAVAVASSIRHSPRDHERAAILAQSLADLGDVSASTPHLQTIESLALKAPVLNSLANVLLARGRWGDASQAIERALEKDPNQIAYAFTAAEVKLASGSLGAARDALKVALSRAREEEKIPGDPAWLCRILWLHSSFARRELAVEMVIEEYVRHGFEAELIAGLVEGTPTSADQTGWNQNLLGAWCAEWGRHSGMRQGIGIVQKLVSDSMEPVNPSPA